MINILSSFPRKRESIPRIQYRYQLTMDSCGPGNDKRKRDARKAFTLIETLIVLTILGLMMPLPLPVVVNLRMVL